MAGKKAGRAGRSAKRGGGSDERSGYKQKIRENQINKNTKKGGCAPKLFMLLLPFVAMGAYLALRS
jgi:hypothetical protein